jgi:anthranilate/para-aminobenzoate synthase component I
MEYSLPALRAQHLGSPMARTTSRHAFLHGPPQPLVVTFPQPAADVFGLYRRIASGSSPSFLLESGKGGPATCRYSFLGADPFRRLRGSPHLWTLTSLDRGLTVQEDAFNGLSKMILGNRIANAEGFPPFIGGAVGYFAYDLVRGFEALPSLATDDISLPEVDFAFFDLIAAVDHRTHTIFGIFCPPLERFLAEPREKLYFEGCDRLAEFQARLSSAPASEHNSDLSTLLPMGLAPEQSREEYMRRVRRCQEYIASGDIYQANLSHRFALTWDAPPDSGSRLNDSLTLELYRRVRSVNPSPFSGLIRFDDIALICCSPERLVRVQGRQAETRPIAGTRPRGATASEDLRLTEELATNAKERAEHLMLVDLERNDLGRVCEYGSVRVDEFMSIEQYSHVSHLVSNVTGTLRPWTTGFDVIRALFPGGTITGVPKIRCMQIIEELEPVRRGPYTGSLGYLSWSGDLDLNIIIRTLVMVGDRGCLQVGAGIVADSVASKEYDETLHKADAFFTALRKS